MKNLMRTTLISLMVSVAATGVVVGQEPKTDPWKACEADFSFEGDHMYVGVTVNDKGPFRFAFDNGYEYSSMIPASAAKAGVGGGQSTLAIGKRSFKISTFLPVMAAPNTDGMLASDFARASVVTIDYPNKKLYIMDKKVFEGERAKIEEFHHIAAEPAGPFLIVTATLDGKGPFRFCHDTGTPTAFVLLPSVAQKNGFAASGKVTLKTSALKTVQEGKMADYPSVDLHVVDHLGIRTYAQKYRYHGTIGNTIFKEDKITLDYEKGRITVWQRTKK